MADFWLPPTPPKGEVPLNDSVASTTRTEGSPLLLSPVGLVLRRLKYALRFIYWTCKHRSTANVRWVLAYEGYSWN